MRRRRLQATNPIIYSRTRSQHSKCLLPLVRLLLAILLVAGNQASWAIAETSRTRSMPVAVAARELTIHETGILHFVSNIHDQIVAKGHGTGTLSGSVTVAMTLALTRASVNFTAYPSTGGTIIGHGEGSIYVGGQTAHFIGDAIITGGSGKYVHASGKNIRVVGTLQRKTLALYVRVEGKMRY